MAPSTSSTPHPSGPFWVGCSGWAYPSWRPDFYPAKTPAKKLLEAYASRLNSVEVNYTFRALPTASMVTGWLNATPETFRFSFKAPQRMTHFQRLRDSGATLASLAEGIEPVRLAGRLGVILFQLPPNFAADTALLDEFLSQAQGTGLRLAFEFRHPSWFGDSTYDTLKRYGAALCVATSDELETPDVATASFACYRLRRSNYSEADLAAVRQTLAERSGQGEVFAYFKHEDEPTGPLRASSVLEGLRA
jgi:uncharacterized protein YecE (DUF72 family)